MILGSLATSMLGSVRHDLMFRTSIAVMLVSSLMVDSSGIQGAEFLDMNSLANELVMMSVSPRDQNRTDVHLIKTFGERIVS